MTKIKTVYVSDDGAEHSTEEAALLRRRAEGETSMKTYSITRRTRPIYSFDGEYNEHPVDIVRAKSAADALIIAYGNRDGQWGGPLYRCEFDDRKRPIMGDQVGPHDDNDHWLGEGDIDGVLIYWDECPNEGYLVVHEVKPEEKLLEHQQRIVAALEAVT